MAEKGAADEFETMETWANLSKELKKHAKSVKNPNDIYQESLKPLDKLAVFVTNNVGTMGFFFIVLFWTTFWLAWNSLAPESLRFDPPTAFVLWLIISNILQILLMPLLLIGQNIQGKRADIRGDHDYETDKRAEKEIQIMLLHFENQQKLMKKILDSVEALHGDTGLEQNK